MQKLNGFQYTTVLDINMGYYTIRSWPASQDMTKIVTEFGQIRYNIPPMVMCDTRDIFQGKLDKLLGDIQGIKTYIDDIFVLRKDN